MKNQKKDVMDLTAYPNLDWLQRHAQTRFIVHQSKTRTVVHLKYVSNEDSEHWLNEVGTDLDNALTQLDVFMTERMKALHKEAKRHSNKAAL